MLTDGVFGDLVDEYMLMSQSTCIDAMYKSYKVVLQILVVLERTKCYRYNPIVIVQCSERVPWDA